MKLSYFILGTAAFFLTVRTVHAETSIDVSNNGDNTHTSVNVHNSSSSTTQSNSTNATHTEVRINNNGEVKTYSSDTPEPVNIQSSDGNTQIHINNYVTGNPPNPTINQEQLKKDFQKKVDNAKKIADQKKAEADRRKQELENKKSVIQKFIENEITILKSLLSSLK